eukprot:TRINITY_DN6316_c0_g1_i2.p2 TRINITY_DN6316_c0_g1~~TRINITY_DN6316_c0_g1_i2.p2  ORF type:complete len:166 (-),score=10.32 TRINITY_DN6316_c0_g1_i2:47-544(-)
MEYKESTEWDFRKTMYSRETNRNTIKWSRQKMEDKRQRGTVTKYTLPVSPDDSMPDALVQYSLSKHKRWEEVEHLRNEYLVKVQEEKRSMPRQQVRFRKLKPTVLNDMKRKYQECSHQPKRRTKLVKGRTGHVLIKQRGARLEFPYMRLCRRGVPSLSKGELATF